LNEFLHLRMRQYAPFQSPAWIQKLPNAIALSGYYRGWIKVNAKELPRKREAIEIALHI